MTTGRNQAMIDDPLTALLNAAAKLAGVDVATVRNLGRALLAIESDKRSLRGGTSGLNYDGSPLQLCLSSSPSRVTCRLLVDPASDLSDPYARYRASLTALQTAVEANGSTSLAPLFERTLRLNLPKTNIQPFPYPDGVLWIAVSLDSPGCALYVDARRGGREAAHARMMNWLKDTCGSTADVDTLVAALGSEARLMCLGIEGVSPQLARAKVYWRLSEPRLLDALGVEGFKDPLFAQFLSLCLGKREIRLTGIVLNAGVGVSTGRWSDFKLDVCGCSHCLNYSPEEAIRVSDSITSSFGLSPLPLQDALQYGDVAFYGLGIDSNGTARFNVYFKPRFPSS